MVDTIKIFIRTERRGDFTLHLSCITNRMLHVFAAAGHHNYVIAARLYVQMMKTFEKGTAEEIAIISSFKENGNHVVRYSSNEWSGVWSDLTIEQTLMKNSKSEGGISGGRFRNIESAQRIWIQTLDHMSLINQLSTKKACKIIHRDLTNAQRLADEEDMQPFNEQTPKEFLVSFSAGFINRKGDDVNPEETIEVGNTIQKKLDGKVHSITVERKSKVKSLESDDTAPINALKYFNRLVQFAQREDNLKSNLGFYELTPIPMSLFSEKDQLMHEGHKATFAKLCLKDKIDLTDNSQDIDIDTVIIDGGWLLRQCTWPKGDKWRDIIDKYCTRVKYLGRSANKTVVIFDGYENSAKDHTHRRRQNQFCHDIKIREDMIPYTTKEKFLSNSSNKSALVFMISTKLSVSNISSICCRDDADTTIVKESLQYSLLGNVGGVAEDADILIILIYDFDINIHKEIRILTPQGHYSVNEIVNNLTPDEKLWIVTHLVAVILFVRSSVVSKEKFYQKICSGQLRKFIDKFYCDTTSIEDIGNAGKLIFQFIYNMPATLSIQR